MTFCVPCDLPSSESSHSSSWVDSYVGLGEETARGLAWVVVSTGNNTAASLCLPQFWHFLSPALPVSFLKILVPDTRLFLVPRGE